jgi:hypothetical protein
MHANAPHIQLRKMPDARQIDPILIFPAQCTNRKPGGLGNFANWDATTARLLKECGWALPGDISADAFIRWRETATATVGRAKKTDTNIVPMSTRNLMACAFEGFLPRP